VRIQVAGTSKKGWNGFSAHHSGFTYIATASKRMNAAWVAQGVKNTLVLQKPPRSNLRNMFIKLSTGKGWNTIASLTE
jgi:hypothetical protein